MLPSNADLSFHSATIDVIPHVLTLFLQELRVDLAASGRILPFSPPVHTCCRQAAEFWFNSRRAAKADVWLDTTALSALADNTVWSTLVLHELMTSAARSGHGTNLYNVVHGKFLLAALDMKCEIQIKLEFDGIWQPTDSVQDVQEKRSFLI